MFSRILPVGIGLLSALLPVVAYAQIDALVDILQDVTGPLLTFDVPDVQLNCDEVVGGGSCRLAGLFVYITQQLRLLINSVAFIIIVVAGFRLIISQSEEAMTTARRTIAAAVIGLFSIFLAEQYVDALYGGVDNPLGPNIGGAPIITSEIGGVLIWIETLVAIGAVGMLVAQAAAALATVGSEDAIRKTYRAVISTVGGILLIMFSRVIGAIFGYTSIGQLPGPPSATQFIIEAMGLVRLLLGFVGIIVIGVIVYAGFAMIVNFGNDELITKGKNALINAAIGLLLIAMSLLIVSEVILGIV